MCIVDKPSKCVKMIFSEIERFSLGGLAPIHTVTLHSPLCQSAGGKAGSATSGLPAAMIAPAAALTLARTGSISSRA